MNAETPRDILGQPLTIKEGFSLHHPHARGTLLLFHGLTGFPTEVEDLAAAVHDSGFNLLVPRLSGHNGEVRALKRTHLVEWQSDALEALAEAQRWGAPVFAGGLSFGALLALYLGVTHPGAVSGLVLLSPPLKFISRLREAALWCLSFLPEALLDSLWVVKKTPRAADEFVRPRNALAYHAVAAAARLVRLRRLVFSQLKQLNCPILIVQDPAEHHLSPRGPEHLMHVLQNEQTDTVWLPGGKHEITIGPRHTEVETAVRAFLQYHTRGAGGRAEEV